MMPYEHDSEFFQWGLQLFESDLHSSYGYCGTGAQDDSGDYCGKYFQQDHGNTECSNVENDELIALALQEQLSQLAVLEVPECQSDGEEHSQMFDSQQDWIGQSVVDYTFGQDCGREVIDDKGPSSSCSSPEENSYCGEDWECTPDLSDDCALVGELGKRLNQMVPIPHVPRINGEIPSIDEATLDHQRLLERLQLYDLVELKVQGDGNCQFRALSDQFYRTTEHHEFVRHQIVRQLKSYPEIYEGYVPMAYEDYLKKMSMSGEWGDHVTLQAAADSYGVKIFVITSFKDTCYIEILPNVQRSKRDMSAFESKKKRRWRMCRNKQLNFQNEYQ